jgi:hypothetical protein
MAGKVGRPFGSLHSTEVRQRIKTAQILNRLNHFVLGTRNGKDTCLMEPHQVSAALGLLKKVLPDLQAVDATIKGDGGGPVLFQMIASDIPTHPKAD